MTGIYRIETDAGDTRGFLNQIAGVLAAVSRHHLSGGERETKGIRLVFEIKNDLSRHSTSPVDCQPSCLDMRLEKINGADERLRRVDAIELSSILGGSSGRLK
jgi:hypothetical protein